MMRLDWKPIDGWGDYAADFDARTRLEIKDYGEGRCRWSMAVIVDYPRSRAPLYDGVIFHLQSRSTRVEAEVHAHEFATELWSKPLLGPAELEAQQKTRWSIYATRVEWLSHVWFTIGNGYEWLDGALVDTSPEDHLDMPERPDLPNFRELIAQTYKLLGKPVPKSLEERPKPPPRLYPANLTYSRVAIVPEDVRPDWLEAAREAYALLASESDPEGLRGLGPYTNTRQNRRVARKLAGRDPRLVARSS